MISYNMLSKKDDNFYKEKFSFYITLKFTLEFYFFLITVFLILH
jgi:hypothetical protein